MSSEGGRRKREVLAGFPEGRDGAYVVRSAEASRGSWNGERFEGGIVDVDAPIDTDHLFTRWAKNAVKNLQEAPYPTDIHGNPVPLPWAVMHVGEAAMWAAEPQGGADV